MSVSLKLYDVIKGPIFTEKSANLKNTERKVLIEVASWANKYSIDLALRQMFNVKPSKINVLNMRGKVKRVRQNLGKQNNFKKAYVTFDKVSDLDIFGVIGQEIAVSE